MRARSLLLAGATLACLLPFAGKAFHIDDPLFVWTARQIVSHPLDFYGFPVNWEGTEGPMSAVTQNPPLAAYFLAMIGALAGWSEGALHLGMLLAAVGAVLGTARLAGHFCSHPSWAALLLLTAPVFLVSSTSVMSDVPMLALWVWALTLWIEEKHAASAVLVALCALTKYFGIALIPLLLVYAWMLRRPLRSWLPWLSLPVAALIAYQAWTAHLYGRGLLWNAAAYATELRVGGGLPSKILATLAFAGGGTAVLLFAAPLLWKGRALLAGAAACVTCGALAAGLGSVGEFAVVRPDDIAWSFVLQLSLWVAAGGTLLGLAWSDARRHRTAASVLLLLWVLGTLVFAGVVNWTVSGRNLLPMVPAAAILIVRRVEERHPIDRLWAPVVLSLGLALLVAHADQRLASSARGAAAAIVERGRPAPVRFQGHWGFQYYMQARGASPLDQGRLVLSSGDVVVVPRNNSYLFPLPAKRLQPWFVHEERLGWIGVMSATQGAGYYSDAWGPLPFAFGGVPSEAYDAYRTR